MVKHTQTIRRQQPTNCLSVFGHFVGFALKELRIKLIATTQIIEPKHGQLKNLNFLG